MSDIVQQERVAVLGEVLRVIDRHMERLDLDGFPDWDDARMAIFSIRMDIADRLSASANCLYGRDRFGYQVDPDAPKFNQT